MKKFANAFIIIVNLFASFVFAEELIFVKEYNHSYTAIRAAMSDCAKIGGTLEGFTLVQGTGWRLYKDNNSNPQKYKIVGNEFDIACEIKQAAGPSRWILTWDSPKFRADCSMLKQEEILGYEILKSGQHYAMSSANQYLTEPLESIDDLEIRTVDVNNLKSIVVKFNSNNTVGC